MTETDEQRFERVRKEWEEKGNKTFTPEFYRLVMGERPPKDADKGPCVPFVHRGLDICWKTSGKKNKAVLFYHLLDDMTQLEAFVAKNERFRVAFKNKIVDMMEEGKRARKAVSELPGDAEFLEQKEEEQFIADMLSEDKLMTLYDRVARLEKNSAVPAPKPDFKDLPRFKRCPLCRCKK